MSDAPHTIMPFADQAGPTFPNNHNTTSFYNDCNYYGLQDSTTVENTFYNEQQQFYQTNQFVTNCDFDQEAVPNILSPWDSDNYNNEDLSKIVDQVLSSIDSQFCEQNSDSNHSTISALFTNGSIELQEPETCPNINGKLELCDNCGMLIDADENKCKSCGHVLTRTNETNSM